MDWYCRNYLCNSVSDENMASINLLWMTFYVGSPVFSPGSLVDSSFASKKPAIL